MRSVIFRKIKVPIFAFLLVLLLPLSVIADPELVTFQGGIGVDPEGGTNVVCGVSPPGAPWTIERLRAEVEANGRIIVTGSGLLLAGGNGIGSNGKQVVRAQLFCNSCSDDSSTSLTGVALEPDGDFRIIDNLSPTPPSTCTNPVLPITQAAAGGKWFAAGIPVRSE